MIRNKALKQSKVRYAEIYTMLMTMIYLNYTVTSQMRYMNVLDMEWIYLSKGQKSFRGLLTEIFYDDNISAGGLGGGEGDG